MFFLLLLLLLLFFDSRHPKGADESSSESVRRKAAAALGELLFYIVTQEQSSARLKANGSTPNSKNAASKWMISDLTFKTILHCLRPSEDPIVRHFCTQTFENILAQSYRGDVYSNFTSHSVASELIKIVSLNSVSGAASSSRNASNNMVDLRATATSALAHLLCSSLRKNWQTGLSILLEVVSTKSVALFCEGKLLLVPSTDFVPMFSAVVLHVLSAVSAFLPAAVGEGHSKLQRSSINILCLLLWEPEVAGQPAPRTPQQLISLRSAICAHKGLFFFSNAVSDGTKEISVQTKTPLLLVCFRSAAIPQSGLRPACQSYAETKGTFIAPSAHRFEASAVAGVRREEGTADYRSGR